MSNAPTLGQLYKKLDKGDDSITTKKEFAVLLSDIYIEDGLNVKNGIYREVVDGLKKAYSSGEYVPKMVVEPQSDGTRFKVIDGHHRFTALTELVSEGHEYRRITVEGFSGSAADQIKLMVTSSQGRNLTPLERAGAYSRLVNQFGWTRGEVVEAFCTTLPSVAHHLSLDELTPVVKHYINHERIAADYALEIFRKSGEDGVIAIVEKVTTGKATRKNTSAWRPAIGKSVVTLLSSVDVEFTENTVRAEFTHEQWDAIQAAIDTLSE